MIFTWKSRLFSTLILMTFLSGAPAMAERYEPGVLDALDVPHQATNSDLKTEQRTKRINKKISLKSPEEEKNRRVLSKKPMVTEEDEVRAVLRTFSEAVSTNDANRLANLWTEDAHFIDHSGASTSGLKNLRERFDRMFAQKKADAITLHPDRISFPAINVAVVEGEVSKSVGRAELPTSKFSLVLIKNDGKWLINSGIETLISEVKAADRLRELSWLIGNWKVDRPGDLVKLEVSWSEGHNFIISKTIIEKKGENPQVDRQIIGFDPRSGCLVSWHFDYNGGFGYGKWISDKDSFTLTYAGVSPNGHDTRASNKFTLKGPDQFTWQSTEQSADDEGIPDTEVMQLVRIK